MQKTLAPYVKQFKKLMFGAATWGGPKEGGSQNYVKISVSLLCHDIKDVAPQLKQSKKLIFVWVHLGVLRVGPPKLCQNSCVLKSSSDTQKI